MHVHRRRVLIAAAVAAASLFFLAAGSSRAEEEERPKIFLEKKVFADTSEGKKSFYEVHTVAKGDSLWKILHGKGTVSGADYGRMVREFRRANPEVANPAKLKVGQKILVPSAAPPPQQDTRVVEGKAAPHSVVRGDTLTRILADRGVPRREVPRYLDAVKKLNESVRDVNRILLGSTILIPTAEYFGKEPPKEAPTAIAKAEPVEPPKEVPPPITPPIAKPVEPPSEPAKPVPPPVKAVEPPPPPQVAAPKPAPVESPPPTIKPVAAPSAAPPKTVSTEPPPAKPVEPPKEIPKPIVVPPPPVKAVEPPPPPQVAASKPAPVEPPKEVPPAPPAAMAKEIPQEPPAPPPLVTAAAPPPEEPAVALTKEVPPVALTKEVPPEPVPAADVLAKPEGQLNVPAPPVPAAPAIEVKAKPTKAEAAKMEEPPLPPPKPPYRGLLTDLLAGLGEKWADRGTLYLPVPSGGEVVLNLEEFPVARFSNGTHVLIDYRGVLPLNIRALVTETWKNYRVVSMEGTGDAWEIVHRLLQASGYHSVKEGIARPLVIGEGVSVTLPARWVVLRTPDSLLTGEVILIKEVPEKPSGDLAAVLRYADRVGIRVLPLAVDRRALEGFLVGLDDPKESTDPPPRMAAPAGGIAALDFALDFLGIPRKEGERLRIGGKGDSFQLTVQPERLFEARGKRYIADAGKMSPALKTLVRDSGYRIFSILKEDTGRTILQRVMKEAGVASEARREYFLSGGERDGYSVRATGTFVTSREWLEGKKAREALLFGGRSHTATRALLRDLGVEFVEW